MPMECMCVCVSRGRGCGLRIGMDLQDRVVVIVEITTKWKSGRGVVGCCMVARFAIGGFIWWRESCDCHL